MSKELHRLQQLSGIKPVTEAYDPFSPEATPDAAAPEQAFDERGFFTAYNAPGVPEVTRAAQKQFKKVVVPAFKKAGGQFANHRAGGTGSANGYDMTTNDPTVFDQLVQQLGQVIGAQGEIVKLGDLESDRGEGNSFSKAYFEYEFEGASCVIRLDLDRNRLDGDKFQIELYDPTVGWPQYRGSQWQPKGIQK